MAAPFNADSVKGFKQQSGWISFVDNMNAALAVGATAQAAGQPLRAQICRFTQAVAGGCCVLPSLSTYDGPPWIMVVNDVLPAVSLTVGGASGGTGPGSFGADKVNGAVTNAGFTLGVQTVATGTSVIFVASYPTDGGFGDGPTASNNNWHTFVGTGT